MVKKNNMNNTQDKVYNRLNIKKVQFLGLKKMGSQATIKVNNSIMLTAKAKMDYGLTSMIVMCCAGRVWTWLVLTFLSIFIGICLSSGRAWPPLLGMILWHTAKGNLLF